MGHMTAKVAVAKAIYAIDRPYDYRVPQELEGRLRPGMRVLVPFGAGNRGSDGIVLALSREGPEGGLKDVIAALDDQPVLDEKLLKLALWMRERYFCTIYDAVKTIDGETVEPEATNVGSTSVYAADADKYIEMLYGESTDAE